MFNVAVKGVKDVIKEFEKDAIRMRSAARTALNQTAYHAAQDQKKEAPKPGRLDRPTPFTLRGFKYQKATVRNLRAAVYIDRIQAEYLQWQVYGGKRSGMGKNVPVPIEIPLNKYGNIIGKRAGKIKKLIARDDTFVGSVKGMYGLWQRGHISKNGKFSVLSKTVRTNKAGKIIKKRATNIRLLVIFVKSVDYEKRLKFYATADRSFHKRFDRELDKALKRETLL